MPSTIQDLCQAIARNSSEDAFTPALQPAQWEVLGSYLQPLELSASQKLIDEGAHDRTLFFVESGSLSVHTLTSSGEIQIAMLHAGSAVGEGAFFSREPRSASVTAAGPTRLWRLTPLRFAEMSNRQPAIALELVLALGQVMSRRMRNKGRRITVT